MVLKAPTPSESTVRSAIAKAAETIVLAPLSGVGPGLALISSEGDAGVIQITGQTRDAVEQMLNAYPEVSTGTNPDGSKLTAAKSAVSTVRSRLLFGGATPPEDAEQDPMWFECAKLFFTAVIAAAEAMQANPLVTA